MSLKSVLKLDATGTMQPRRRAATYPELTRALKSYLAIVAGIKRRAVREAGRYASTEELVLFNAKPVWANMRAMILPPMTAKECFDNAVKVVSENPEYRYAEGYALMDGSIPTHHGWVVGPEGDIQDPTWPTLYQAHAEREPAKDWSGRAVYMGITVDRDVHQRWMERTGYPNILAVYEEDVAALLRDGLDALTA